MNIQLCTCVCAGALQLEIYIHTHATGDNTQSHQQITVLNVKGLLANSNHFKSLWVNKLITGVICSLYNYLPVKYPALSLTFLFYYCVAFSSVPLTRALGMVLWKIKAKIILWSTDFANWSCHFRWCTVSNKATWQEAPCNLHNPGFQLWISVTSFVVLEAHKQPQRDAVTYAQYWHSSLCVWAD